MPTAAFKIVFSPSLAQRRLLDQLHEHPAAHNTLALCRDAGISRTTFYRWCKEPEFCRWLGSAWASRLLLEGAAHINCARALAPTKFPYWKAVFELIFDPKGLALLAQWQSSLTHLPADAFLAAPPRPELPGQAARSVVRALSSIVKVHARKANAPLPRLPMASLLHHSGNGINAIGTPSVTVSHPHAPPPLAGVAALGTVGKIAAQGCELRDG
ncbi:MAG: hypothetical protein ACRD1C_12465 [Terriglobales bacterium]